MAIGISELALPIGALIVIGVLVFFPKLLKKASDFLFSRKKEIVETGKDIKKKWSSVKETVKQTVK